MTPLQEKKNRYAVRFGQLQKEGRKAFIPFTLLGWPDLQTSREVIQTMIDSGVTALELGIPFSDPVADGPLIQEAACQTVANGFRVDDAFSLLREIRLQDEEIPIGLLVYYNLILVRGIERFFEDLCEAGVDGILIPDLPPEAAGEVFPVAQRFGIELIFIVSPLTSEKRLEVLKTYAGGFLYIVSRLGITGVEERYDTELKSLMAMIRSHIHLPLCVGFGISTPAHANTMVSLGADGVIVGSKIIQLIKSCVEENRSDAVRNDLGNYLNEMLSSLESSECLLT